MSGVPDSSFFVPDLPAGTFERSDVRAIEKGKTETYSFFGGGGGDEGAKSLCFSIVAGR